MPVDDALYKLDHYLNETYVAGTRIFRIVHGKGGGTLRNAVQDYLKHHPLVKSFRTGSYGEGEHGVTIVELV